jgi:ATP-dependent Lon protease
MHVPAGAIPKDGPSAGVTVVTALVSELTGQSVRGVVGMTGEVTLQGQVLPVGGVKQKVLAAHRHGLKTVILPLANEVDLDDVPQEIRDELSFVLVEHLDEVLEMAIPCPPSVPPASRGEDPPEPEFEVLVEETAGGNGRLQPSTGLSPSSF